MALLKAKQGALEVEGNQIAVSDISFDTEFDKIEYDRLDSRIINTDKNITIGSFGKVKCEMPLIASGDSQNPDPLWSKLFELNGYKDTSNGAWQIFNSIYQGNKQVIVYVSGYKIVLNNCLPTNISFSYETGNIPKVSFEIIGIVDTIADYKSLDVGYQTQPVICNWTIDGYSISDLISFNIANDFKVEKVYTVNNCNPKLVQTEHNGSFELVVLGDYLSQKFSQAKNSNYYTIYITNNADTGNKITVNGTGYIEDVKIGENNGLTTLIITGRKIWPELIKFE